MKKILILSCLLFTIITATAQEEFTISGKILDAGSGETLISASVYAPKASEGTTTNVYGFYSLTLPANDSLEIIFSYIGFQTMKKKIYLTADQTINIELSSGELLDEIVVSAESYKEELNSTQMSVTKLTMKEAKLLPALFGEVDIIKTLQLKPGVQSGGEGTSGVFVRGGGSDQNLFLLDEAVVYNPSHLFGFFSTFNSDAIKDVKLYKGGFPAQYGGRLSSVLDIRLNDGNRKKFSGAGGIGIIASRLTLEGPIVKDKGSFMVSGRRTYIDQITNQVNNANSDNPDAVVIPGYYFYDLNAKLNYDLGENDRVYLSGYTGRDIFNFGTDNFEIGLKWGNTTATARWNHIFNPRLFMNVTATYSAYEYEITNEFSGFSFELGSEVSDVGGSVDFTYAPNNDHAIRFGANTIYHQFGIGRLQAGNEDQSFAFSAGTDLDGVQMGVYINDEWTVSDKLSLNGGLRISGFLNDDDRPDDGVEEATDFDFNLEPRFSVKYSLEENFSLKASYTRMNQYLHLVSNSGASLPTDIWYPSTANVLPEVSDQVALGGTYVINDKWLISNEIFHKWLGNQIDFREGANLFVNDNLEREFVYGTGRSYGNEFYIERTKGKLTGWIGYTLAWSWRKFDDILNGKEFPFRNDRRHDLSVVGIYELSDKWVFSAAFVYSTGNAVSLADGFLISQDIDNAGFNTVPTYTDRNSYRIPAYHRADISVVRNFKHSWGKSDLTLSVYNVYDRRNVFFIYTDNNADELTLTSDGTNRPLELTDFPNLVNVAKQVSLFPVLPSITWNFKF
jgi:hypothetical protein